MVWVRVRLREVVFEFIYPKIKENKPTYTMYEYKDLLHLSEKALKKLNRYRTYMGNEMIMSE